MEIHEHILETLGDTPLVRLRRFHPTGAALAAKLEYFNPGGSVKDRIGTAMIEAGERAGLPADLALRLARETVAGSGELARLSPGLNFQRNGMSSSGNYNASPNRNNSAPRGWNAPSNRNSSAPRSSSPAPRSYSAPRSSGGGSSGDSHGGGGGGSHGGGGGGGGGFHGGGGGGSHGGGGHH